MNTYNLVRTTVPGASTVSVVDENASGQLAGSYTDASGQVHGYIYAEGNITEVLVPGSTFTAVAGLSDQGVIAGRYVDTDQHGHGFVVTDGQISTVNVPNASNTSIQAESPGGNIAGIWVDTKGIDHGFVQDKSGLSTFDAFATNPLDDIVISDINDKGQVFGRYYSFFQKFQKGSGFIHQPDSTVTGAGGLVTAANEAGDYVGFNTEVSGKSHGFIYSNGTNSTVDVPGASGTSFSDINDVGAAVGNYQDASGHSHGFLLRDGIFSFFDVPGASDTSIAHISNAGIIAGTSSIPGEIFTADLSDRVIRSETTGSDSVVINYALTQASLSYDSAGDVVLDGPNSTHATLSGFMHFQFTDGTVNEHSGSPLVDDLFYYIHNKDVWNAHADATAHYNANGWHEGRDPNAEFSTSGYLAANPDVAAAGVNPLTHYDTSGWHEGRDPSASFDNELYLARNPDVAQAGIDPLAHYLLHGQAEGRQAYAAIGRAADLATHPGFDAEYYLLNNPDVALAAISAGGDRYAFAYNHYEANGWHEGRNPNAIFDTKGYLAAYGDVKAAIIDPLTHYDNFGWREGRDPSANFDTKAYESHYPDIANAHIDPMLHYLQHGALEGRSAFGDGFFGV